MPNVSPLRYPFDMVIISQIYQFRPSATLEDFRQ